MKNLKRVWLPVILLAAAGISLHAQSGTIGEIEVIEDTDGKMKFNIYDITVKGMKERYVHFGMWLSQEGEWLEDTWVEIEPQLVLYDPVLWSGHAFWFHYPFENLISHGDPDIPYWASFFVIDTEAETVVAREDAEFSLCIDAGTADYEIATTEGEIVSTFEWAFGSKRYKENFVISQSDLNLSVMERDNFQPSAGSSGYEDGYIMLSDLDIVTFYSELYGFLYQKNRFRLSDIKEKLAAMQKKYSLGYREFAEFTVSCIQHTEYLLPEEMYGIFTQPELIKTRTGDCDTRSVLLYTLLKDLGYDVVILYSEYYGHAMLGIAGVGTGDYLKHEGIKYYFVETTATGWDIGSLPPDWSNKRHWLVLVPVMR